MSLVLTRSLASTLTTPSSSVTLQPAASATTTLVSPRIGALLPSGSIATPCSTVTRLGGV